MNINLYLIQQLNQKSRPKPHPPPLQRDLVYQIICTDQKSLFAFVFAFVLSCWEIIVNLINQLVLLYFNLGMGSKKNHRICDHDHTRQGVGSLGGHNTLLCFSMLLTQFFISIKPQNKLCYNLKDPISYYFQDM